MSRERLEKIALVLISVIAGGILFIVTMQSILPVALPFLIAWFVAFAVRDPSRRLAAKTHVSERILRPVLAILIAIAFFIAVGVILWQMISLVSEILSEIGEGNNPVYDLLLALSQKNSSLLGDFLPDELAEEIGAAIGNFLSSALSWIAGVVTGWAGTIPGVLLFVLITLVSLIYFSIDLEKINALVRRLLPKRVSDTLSRIRVRLFSVAGKYMGSYIIIFAITFVTMLVGLLLLRVKRSVTLALLIAFLDILPVIGVGTVLLPWSVISLATGDTVLGIGLILLFVANTVIRECAEPRILGKTLGIHPILSLVLIYAGYELFGFAGMLLTPIAAGVIGLVTGRELSLSGILRAKNDSSEVD